MVSSRSSSSKVAGKAANNGNAVKPASNGGGMLPLKARGFSPKKLSLPSKVGVENPISLFSKESVNIKICMNGFVVIWITRTFLDGKKSSGWIKPINDITICGQADVDGIRSQQKLNIQASRLLFLCNSPQSEKKKSQDYVTKYTGKVHNFICVVGYPNINHYGIDNKQGELEFTVDSERLMVDDVKHLLVTKAGKSVDTIFTPFIPAKHSQTNYDDLHAMDSILIGESIGYVLCNYILPEDLPLDSTYQYLKDNPHNGFFTRHPNGKFALFAVTYLGYPTDIKLGCDQKSW